MRKVPSDDVSNTLSLRLILLMSGVWWLVLMLPTARWLKARPGLNLPPQLNELKTRNTSLLNLAYVHFAWTFLFCTLKAAYQLKQVVIFLAAWFMMADAMASVSGTAVLYARTELKIGTVGIALLSITAIGSGVLESALIPLLVEVRRWTSSPTILFCLLLMEVTPIYGLAGYLPIVQRLGWGGLQQAWEFYPLAVIHGIAMASLSAYCRSVYGQLVPRGSEAAFYALYAITDKGSSAIGPTVFGRIVDLTGHIRPAFWFLAALIAIPMPLIYCLDIRQAQIDAMTVLGGADTTDITLSPLAPAGSEEQRSLIPDHDGDTDS